MASVFFKTFGCKLNQAETSSLIEQFERRGYDLVSDGTNADVIVLNTCSVTGRSDSKCRQAIRYEIKRNSDATVLVAGCYTQIAAHEIVDIAGVDYIFGTQEKFRIFDHFEGPGKLTSPRVFISPVESQTEALSFPGHSPDHTRAFLKIQDGCNYRCSYCIVPLARGPSRSVFEQEIIDQASLLIDRDYQEIVLTGVHVGDYGRDLDNNVLLPGLLLKLIKLPGLGRLRLTSLDPQHIDNILLDSIQSSSKICRHFHVPVQSGSDSVLGAMKRRYNTETALEKIEMILSRFPDAGLGTDIIVGFPGEAPDHFNDTVDFVRTVPFTYLHVFPYSPRPKTPAAGMKNTIPSGVTAQRAKELRRLAVSKHRSFMNKWIGREADILLESANAKGWMEGLTSEYLRVEIPYEASLMNRLVRVRLMEVHDQVIRGQFQSLLSE